MAITRKQEQNFYSPKQEIISEVFYDDQMKLDVRVTGLKVDGKIIQIDMSYMRTATTNQTIEDIEVNGKIEPQPIEVGKLSMSSEYDTNRPEMAAKTHIQFSTDIDPFTMINNAKELLSII